MSRRLAIAALLLAPVLRAEEAPVVDASPVTIVVTGTRTPRKATEDPVGTEVYAAKELEAKNVRDVSRALEDEPGIQTERSFRGASFQLRGLEAKYVRVLQDAMPLVGQVNDVIDLRRFPMEGVERIEVVKGAASSLYGSDALAGVINLVSRRPRREREASGYAQYGMLNSSGAGLWAGTKRGRIAASLSLNWAGNDSYDLTPGNLDLSTNGDARRAATGTARLFWKPSERLDVMAFVRAGHFDTRGVDLQLPRALWNRRVGEDETAAGGTATLTPSAATRWTVLGQGNRFARSFYRQQRQGPGLDDQRSTETLGRAEVQGDHAYGEALSLTGGLGGQQSVLESPRLAAGGASAMTGWSFGQAELKRSGVGELIAGTRVDADRQYGTHFSPRIAARVGLERLAEGLALRGNVGRGFRAPSLGERYLEFRNGAANYVVRGNAALKPETAWSSQFSFEWAPPASGLSAFVPSLRLTAHRTDLSGLIQPVDRSGGQNTDFVYENYATARVQGFEGAVRVAHRRWLVVDAGYAALDARGVLDGVEKRLPGRAGRQLTWGLVATREASGTEFALRGQYQTHRQPLDTEETAFAPSLLLCDAKLSQRVGRVDGTEVRAYLSVENLANDTDITFLALPGRLVLAGFQARL
jgi:outer membrane receptor for ferrienterochelin and colicins